MIECVVFLVGVDDGERLGEVNFVVLSFVEGYIFEEEKF